MSPRAKPPAEPGPDPATPLPRNILSLDGAKIGSIGQVYTDDDNGQPTWATAKTGLFGTSESFVPLEGARIEGNDVVVPYTKDQVKDAPRVDVDGHLDTDGIDDTRR